MGSSRPGVDFRADIGGEAAGLISEDQGQAA